MDWKENLVTSITVCIATMAATGAFFWTVITPVMIKSGENKIADLNKTVVSLSHKFEKKEKQHQLFTIQSKNKQKELQSKLDTLQEQLASLQKINLKLRLSNLFSIEDPYPIKFRGVRIGDSKERIFESYDKDIIEDSRFWYSVHVKDTLFSDITYYKGECNGAEIITKILFHLNRDGYDWSGVSGVAEDDQAPSIFSIVYDLLIEKFGYQHLHETNDVYGDKEFHFHLIAGHHIILEDSLFVIHRYWPVTESEREQVSTTSMGEWRCRQFSNSKNGKEWSR